MLKCFHVKYPLFLLDFNETSFLDRVPGKKKIKYQVSSKSVQWEPNSSMWAEGQTDGHEANSRFSQVCERVQKSSFLLAERLAVCVLVFSTPSLNLHRL